MVIGRPSFMAVPAIRVTLEPKQTQKSACPRTAQDVLPGITDTDVTA